MKILFIDDEQNILNTIKRNLSSRANEWQMSFLNDSQKAMEKIEIESPDLVVTDAKMPIVSGLDIARSIRLNENTKKIPCIMMTGFDDEELRNQALMSGVIEFVNKPIFPAEFILRIENVLHLKKLINELEEANEKLLEYSNTDELTGLFNRRYMINSIKHNISLHKRYKRPFLIFMFDIDNFKKINDTYGHLEGDNLLKTMSSLLKKSLRETDVICRYGGDEFLIIMPETAINEAELLKNRILQSVRAFILSDKPIAISGGIVEYTGEELDTLIKRADDLIYQVKSAGKNNIYIDAKTSEIY